MSFPKILAWVNQAFKYSFEVKSNLGHFSKSYSFFIPFDLPTVRFFIGQACLKNLRHLCIDIAKQNNVVETYDQNLNVALTVSSVQKCSPGWM